MIITIRSIQKYWFFLLQTGYFIETENSIYSTISELIKCHKSQLKPNSAVPKNQLASIKEMDAQPASLALTMVEDVTNEKLAPAHAIERGLLHKLCKHGLNKMVASLFGPQSKFTSGVNARYKGKTVRTHKFPYMVYRDSVFH